MDSTEVISLATTVASLVLAVVAIWLSIIFFRMSSELAEHTKEAAKGIGASVERLEKLFDKLYADTFSMMRDTVSDMRKHIWPEENSATETLREEVENKADERMAELREHMEQELSSILSRQMKQDDRIKSLRGLLDRAIENSRDVASEARDETIRSHLQKLLSARPRVSFMDLLDALPISPGRLVRELRRLEAEDLVLIRGNPLREPDTLILVSPRMRKKLRTAIDRSADDNVSDSTIHSD